MKYDWTGMRRRDASDDRILVATLLTLLAIVLAVAVAA